MVQWLLHKISEWKICTSSNWACLWICRANRKLRFEFGIYYFKDAAILNDCKALIHREWTEEFHEVSMEKGKLYYNFNNEPRSKPWQVLKLFSNKDARILARIVTGHIRKSNEEYICNVCNEKNNITHIIKKCIKYKQKRRNYKRLEYIEIKNYNLNDFRSLIKFIW